MKQKTRIGILDFSGMYASSRNATQDRSKQVNMLREAIKEQGHVPVTYRVEKSQLYFHGRKAEILYNNKKINSCDVLIPKVAASVDVDLEVSIVNQFQLMGVPVVNGYLPISRAKNKLRTLQILTRYGVPSPCSIVVRRMEFIDEAIKKVNGFPVVLKTPFGSWGKGVVLVESSRSLYSALDVLWRGNRESNIIIIQAYVAEAEGSDYRAFVLGDKVVAAMKRTAKPGDFRSNINVGGVGEKVTLSEEDQKLAVRASQALGLKMSGVDILHSKSGPLVMEVNANPGFVGLSNVSGTNIAAEIVKYAVTLAKKD
jgi:ribosomal protein S6--L-glutamate ligase